MIIFTYAPAGLGHLRVTDALYEGLPTETSPLLLGSQAKTITVLHRLLSVHPVFRRLFEWGQSGPFQDLITHVYRWHIRSQRHLLYQQLVTLLDQRIELPEQVLIVATHYGLAHQAAAIKEELAAQRQVDVFLVVQVTDDSPQYIWSVPEADLTMVPSQYTKDGLEEYAKEHGYETGEIMVTAYPISPQLSEKLSKAQQHERLHQFNLQSRSRIHVSIPISGAAVQLNYATNLVDQLHQHSDRFLFHIVSRSAPYTLFFLRDMIERPFAKLYVSEHDREVVNMYESVYDRHRIALEITKPSEQAFKALLQPDQKGGSILLFTEAVGRQEYENIDFLRRNGLVPYATDLNYLWEQAQRNADPTQTKTGSEILEKAGGWRGLILPETAEAASSFIVWCFHHGIFTRMMQYERDPSQTNTDEVHSYGVRAFWEHIARRLRQNDSHSL